MEEHELLQSKCEESWVVECRTTKEEKKDRVDYLEAHFPLVFMKSL